MYEEKKDKEETRYGCCSIHEPDVYDPADTVSRKYHVAIFTTANPFLLYSR
jgi:hypothetical protein